MMLTNDQLSRQTHFGLWSIVVFLALTTLHRHALGDGPAQQSDDISPEKNDAAETRMLQKSVNEQQQQIASLRAEIAALKAQLQSFGLEPQTGDTTRPAVAGKAKRIIYIYAENSQAVDTEIHKAVAALDSDQWFNIYTLYMDRVNPYTPKFIQATDFNKKKFQSSFHPGSSYMVDLRAGVTVAARVNPDVIWVVGSPFPPPDENTLISALHTLAPAFHGRIDTVGEFVSNNTSVLHMMWRLSHETGGVCVDKDGNAMGEPALPLSAPAMPPPKPEPQTPSILRDQP
jgi:hypothetical protein